MNWFYIAFISAILSAVAAVLQKKVLFKYDALEFSFVLSVVNSILILLLINSVDFSSVNYNGILVLYLKTIMGAFAFWFVMLAIKNMEISGALPLMVLTPGFVAIFSFFLLGEIVQFIEILGMILLLCGTYILEIKKGDNIFQPFRTFLHSNYHHYIVYALLLFTFSSILDKVVLKNYKIMPLTFVFFQQIFLAINFLIIVLLKNKNPYTLLKSVDRNTFLWILIISIATLGYRYTQIEAFKIAPIALVLSVKRTSVFFASVFGGKLFSEHYIAKKSFAIIVMLAGAYLLT